MRLFVALDIEDEIRNRFARFLEGVREFAPDARWVRAESLHVTLKFIGEQPSQRAEDIKKTLAGIQSPASQIIFRGFAFFPTQRSARVFWAGVEADSNLASLAGQVEQRLIDLGLPAEDHAFNPHLTLARGSQERRSSGAPKHLSGDRANRNFQRLQDKLAAMPVPEFGTMTARELFLYESKLSPAGPRYTRLERFALS